MSKWAGETWLILHYFDRKMLPTRRRKAKNSIVPGASPDRGPGPGPERDPDHQTIIRKGTLNYIKLLRITSNYIISGHLRKKGKRRNEENPKASPKAKVPKQIKSTSILKLKMNPLLTMILMKYPFLKPIPKRTTQKKLD